MFQEKKLVELFQSLGPEEQDEAIDFMEFLKQKAIRTQQTAVPSRLYFGCMKGLVTYMADDFDAPLDDFAEYM